MADDTDTTPTTYDRREEPASHRPRAPRVALTALTVALVVLAAAFVAVELRTNSRLDTLRGDVQRLTAAQSRAAAEQHAAQVVQDRRLTGLEQSTGALSTQISDAKRKIAAQDQVLQQTISKLPADWQSIVQHTMPSVVEVDCVPPSGGGAGGTGFAVRLPTAPPTGYVTAVLTNDHVVSDCQVGSTDQVTVSKNGQTWPAELAAAQYNISAATDIALLYTTASLPPLPTAAPPAEGGDVGALGNPLAAADVFTAGKISKLWDDGWIQHTAALNHGNSGGPLLDAHGNVVGINTWGIETAPDGSPVHDSFFAEPIKSACVLVPTNCPFR